jgi:hypothetical protein
VTGSASVSAATIFDDLEERDLPWHIDERDKDPRPEEKRQLAFLNAARMMCPAVAIFAVPNGGKRSQWAAMKAKREGMKAGVLDLVCTWPGGVAFLEFKDSTSMPDANQRERLNLLTRQGHHCGVFRQEHSALPICGRAGRLSLGGCREPLTTSNERDTWLDLFAGGLERGLSLQEAAAALGKSTQWGWSAFNEICERLGPQAV